GQGPLTPGAGPGTREAEGNRTQRHVHRGGAPETGPDADVLDQEEASQRGARYGTECVQAVEPAQRWLEPRTVGTRERPREDRQGTAHQARRNQQHHGREPEPQRYTGAAS